MSQGSKIGFVLAAIVIASHFALDGALPDNAAVAAMKSHGVYGYVVLICSAALVASLLWLCVEPNVPRCSDLARSA